MTDKLYRAFSLCLLVAASAFAQADKGSIGGTITDASGAVVPGAAVKIVALATNQTRSTVSNGAGGYNFPFLAPGNYSLHADAPGFQAIDVKTFTVQVGQAAQIDLSLKTGKTTERVEVTASSVGLQTESAAVGTVIDNTKVVQLPLNGRSFIQLALLSPGVNPVTPGSLSQRSSGGALGQPVGMNANGARDNQNRYYYDGVMAMALGSLSFSYSLSVDAIQEFKVDTSNYSAQIGAAPGGQVNLTTKGGSNLYHGTLWEFNRNNKLTTLAPFQAYSPTAAPPRLNRNQYGANLGGPLSIPKLYKGKDRTFFFLNWESGRLIQGTAGNSAFVPPSAYRTGDFSSSSVKVYDPTTGSPFPGNIIPSNRIQSFASQYLTYVPAPNSNQAAVNYYSPASSAPTIQDQYVGRVDQHVSDRNELSFVYDYNQQRVTTVPTYSYWDNTSTYTLAKHAVLSDVHTFSPSLVNESRLGWDRYAKVAQNGASGVSSLNIANLIGIGGVSNDPRNYGSPTFSLGYNVPTTSSIGPASQGNQLWQYEDNVSWQKGRHSLHMGAQIMRWNEWFAEAYNPRGTFSFDGRTTTLNGATPSSQNTFAAFLLGLATSAGVSPDTFQTRINSTWQSYYVQDDWKILPNFTLNFGVRYEYFQPMVQRGKVANFELNGAVPGFTISNEIFRNVPGHSDVSNFPASLVYSDKNNFGPRIGFAWSVPHFSDLVVRGAYGIFYTPELPNSYVGLTFNPPIVSSQSYTGTYAQPIQVTTAFSGTGSTVTGQLGSGGIDPYLRDTYVQQWNFTIEKKLPGNVLFDIGYVGNKGTDLTAYYDANRPITIVNPTATTASLASRRPYQGFSTVNMVKSIGDSTYHSLQAKAERRVANGLTFIGAFTWSKALTTVDQSSVGGGYYSQGIQNIFDLSSEKAPAAFDLHYRFSLAVVYDIPFLKSNGNLFVRTAFSGWQLGVIDTQQSGVAAGLSQVGDTTGTGISSRPSVVFGQSASLSDPTRTKWFNTSAFVLPTAGTFGNAARTVIYLPGIENIDASLTKSFHVKERAHLQIRADVFNVVNHVNLGAPGLSLTTPNTFGVITTSIQGSDTSGSQRIIQFGAKFVF